MPDFDLHLCPCSAARRPRESRREILAQAEQPARQRVREEVHEASLKRRVLRLDLRAQRTILLGGVADRHDHVVDRLVVELPKRLRQ